MSLGLPEFGSRGAADAGRTFWRIVKALGFATLVYSLLLSGIEWQAANSARLSIEKASDEVAQARRAAAEMKQGLQKNAELLVATASIESSPERVLSDLETVLPEGVAISSLKIDYLPEATARVEFDVVARSPGAYDRFLNALSKSPLFAEIKPGAESRPGLVRAIVSAIHRPKVQAPPQGTAK